MSNSVSNPASNPVSNPEASRFCMAGRFLSFLPGEKSSYQRLSLAILQGRGGAIAPHFAQETHQILLSKDLRRMMYRYLLPQDWISVVGKQVINPRSAQMEWKAAEIYKLSALQIDQLKQVVTVPEPAKALKPARVLVCQASGCRQRGSLAIEAAIAQTLATADHPEKVTVQATGCLKRCKAGPNIVMLPGGSYSQLTVKKTVALMQQMLEAASAV